MLRPDRTRGPRRGRFWDRVHAHRRAPAGSDWNPLGRGPWRPTRRGGPARPCLGGSGSAWGDALGVQTGVLVSRGRPCDAGVSRGVGQGCWSWQPPAWWQRHGWVRAAGGPRSRRGGACGGRHLSVPVQGSPAQDACATPLGRARFGTVVHPPAAPASPPRRNSACHGGRSACGSEGHREVTSATSAPTCPPQGFPGPPCPSPENRPPEGDDAGSGPAEPLGSKRDEIMAVKKSAPKTAQNTTTRKEPGPPGHHPRGGRRPGTPQRASPRTSHAPFGLELPRIRRHPRGHRGERRPQRQRPARRPQRQGHGDPLAARRRQLRQLGPSELPLSTRPR